jgi:hypothetical protein
MRKLENEGIRKKGTSYKLAPAEGIRELRD